MHHGIKIFTLVMGSLSAYDVVFEWSMTLEAKSVNHSLILFIYAMFISAGNLSLFDKVVIELCATLIWF